MPKILDWVKVYSKLACIATYYLTIFQKFGSITILYWVFSRRKCLSVLTGPGLFWGGEAYRSNRDVPKPKSAAGRYSMTG